MSRFIILACLAALIAAGSAQAHATKYRWTEAKAERELTRQGMSWPSGIHDRVNDVACRGAGSSVYVRKLHSRAFKHFVCDVESTNGETGLPEEPRISLHVLGLHRFTQAILIP